jgi:hypothetical protein
MKFNEFDTLLESAIALNAGGGFKENTPVKLRPAFFKSDYFKNLLSANPQVAEYLKAKTAQDYFFFIKQVVSTRGATDANSGVDPLYLKLKHDPRTPNAATELNEFDVPASLDYVEVLNFGINMPPVQADKTLGDKYTKFTTGQPEPAENYFMRVGDKQLGEANPKKNTKLANTKDPEKWKVFNKK